MFTLYVNKASDHYRYDVHLLAPDLLSATRNFETVLGDQSSDVMSMCEVFSAEKTVFSHQKCHFLKFKDKCA